MDPVVIYRPKSYREMNGRDLKKEIYDKFIAY